MKILKKLMICFTMFILFMVNTNTVSATEATGLAGDVIVNCNLSINLVDMTGNYDEDKIVVTFADITGTVTQEVELIKDNSWGIGMPVDVLLPAPTTYNITFSGLKSGYKVVDSSTKEEITNFAASEGMKVFAWSLVTDESDDNEIETSEIDRDNVTVNNKKAETVYQEFIDAVSFIETDSSWYDGVAALLNQYGKESINKDTYSQWYADYVQGGTIEEYFAMSSYEQFLWTETYTRLAYAVGGSNNFNQYFGDEGTYKIHIKDVVTNLMNGNNSETVIAAYEKLMDWQYEYVKENGVPFNFIRNRNYIEEIKEVPVHEEDSVMTEEQEIQEALDEVLEEEQEEGVWSGVIKILASNAVSILILIILGIALAVAVYIRKKKN